MLRTNAGLTSDEPARSGSSWTDGWCHAEAALRGLLVARQRR